MAVITHGTVTVQIPDTIEVPPESGNLSAEQVAEIPKARRGLGLACEQTATALANAGATFLYPNVTPDDLRKKGRMAEEIDEVITAVEVVLGKLEQANLILDAAAWEDCAGSGHDGRWRWSSRHAPSEQEYRPDRFPLRRGHLHG